jgi:hypothetical protein
MPRSDALTNFFKQNPTQQDAGRNVREFADVLLEIGYAENNKRILFSSKL